MPRRRTSAQSRAMFAKLKAAQELYGSSRLGSQRFKMKQREFSFMKRLQAGPTRDEQLQRRAQDIEFRNWARGKGTNPPKRYAIWEPTKPKFEPQQRTFNFGRPLKRLYFSRGK